MRRFLPFVIFLLLFVSCVHSRINPDLLKGAWRSDHESFDFDIRQNVILYEFDMQEHPYTLDGDLLTVDLGPDSGINRARILELTEKTLTLQDLETGKVSRYSRMQ